MGKPVQYDLAEIEIFDSLDDIPDDLLEEFKGMEDFGDFEESYEEAPYAEIPSPPEKEAIPDFETFKREMGIPTLAKPKRKIPKAPRYKKTGSFAPTRIGRKVFKKGFWRDSKGRFTKKPRGLK